MCSKNLISNLGISITYDRILQLEENRALSMCRQYQLNNVVCPSHLQKGHFIGGIDNVDHNPSSTLHFMVQALALLSILCKILALLLNKVSHLLQTLLMSFLFLLPMACNSWRGQVCCNVWRFAFRNGDVDYAGRLSRLFWVDCSPY